MSDAHPPAQPALTITRRCQDDLQQQMYAFIDPDNTMWYGVLGHDGRPVVTRMATGALDQICPATKPPKGTQS